VPWRIPRMRAERQMEKRITDIIVSVGELIIILAHKRMRDGSMRIKAMSTNLEVCFSVIFITCHYSCYNYLTYIYMIIYYLSSMLFLIKNIRHRTIEDKLSPREIVSRNLLIQGIEYLEINPRTM